MAIILGIDPGSRITGYGLITTAASQVCFIGCGLIKTNKNELSQRLQQIYHDINEIILEYQPTAVAIEKVFVHRNVDSALKLGHARGAALVACANHYLPIYEYSPREIKQAIVGYGAADKNQVQQMIARLMGLSEVPKSDAADALAVAICHDNHHQAQEKIARALKEE